MNPEFVMGLVRESVELTLLVAGPLLAFGLVVGLAVSVFQAVTQIQELTLTFVPKIVAMVVALVIFFPWMLQLMVDFTVRLYEGIPLVIR